MQLKWFYDFGRLAQINKVTGLSKEMVYDLLNQRAYSPQRLAKPGFEFGSVEEQRFTVYDSQKHSL